MFLFRVFDTKFNREFLLIINIKNFVICDNSRLNWSETMFKLEMKRMLISIKPEVIYKIIHDV